MKFPLRRGNLSSSLGYIPTQAMNFTFEEWYQHVFILQHDEVGFTHSALPHFRPGHFRRRLPPKALPPRPSEHIRPGQVC